MKRRPRPGRTQHDRWLISYADFITLLFAFFVVLFASAQADKKKQALMAGAIAHAFGHNNIQGNVQNAPQWGLRSASPARAAAPRAGNPRASSPPCPIRPPRSPAPKLC